MTPYYEHGGITIYHGDCRLILPSVRPVDLLCTDPPYGLGAARRNFGGNGVRVHKSGLMKGKASSHRDYGDAAWDDQPPSDWMFGWLRELSKNQIIWGGNYFPLPPSKGWLVWDKLRGETDYADCELGVDES